MFQKDDLNQLYRYALALTHDEPRAYDLLQSAVTRTLGRSVENPNAYARRTLRNIYYDEWRSHKNHPSEPLESASEIVDLNADLEKVTVTKDELNHLLKKVSPLDREILFLWAVEELTYAEISEELQIKRGTLLSRINRMRKKLSQEVNNEKTS